MIDLSDIDRRSFAKIRNPKTKKYYLRMEYEVRVSFDYPRLTYEIIIPRNGKFPDALNWGDNPIRKPAILNCAAAMDVTRPQAHDTPVRPSSSVFTPTPACDAALEANLMRPILRSTESCTTQRSLNTSEREKSCQRCWTQKVKCIKRTYGRPCYKCIRAGQECIGRS